MSELLNTWRLHYSTTDVNGNQRKSDVTGYERDYHQNIEHNCIGKKSIEINHTMLNEIRILHLQSINQIFD
jgi:hypothetical protein